MSVRASGHVYCILGELLLASVLQNPGAGAVREEAPPEGGPAERPHVPGKECLSPGPGGAGSAAGGARQPGTGSLLPSGSWLLFLVTAGSPHVIGCGGNCS